MHFPPATRQAGSLEQLILVEDILSATKVAQVAPAAALLGTTLSKADCLYLKSIGVRDVILILDPDAISTAIRIKHRVGGLFRNFYVVPVVKDPKAYTTDELKSLLKEYI